MTPWQCLGCFAVQKAVIEEPLILAAGQALQALVHESAEKGWKCPVGLAEKGRVEKESAGLKVAEQAGG